jgi:hydroxymethylbilane synthase
MAPLAPRTITLGTRPSKLAQWQSAHTLAQLQAAWPGLDCRMITLTTQGDRILDRPLPEIGGKGVFTEELEMALLSGEIDLAVHSLKDLPIDAAPGLCLGAVSARANAQDVLISAEGHTLATLPQGAQVGTSSLRREAQLRMARPDLRIRSLRGNVDTRLRKAREGEYAAIVLAAAGLERLELTQPISEYLALDVMLPAPGQGVLAVQCRADDADLLRLLQPIHNEPAFRAVTAERAFLAGLGGGCSAPVAAYAENQGQWLSLRGLVATPDGRHVIRVSAEGQDPAALGQALAHKALSQGAREILA